MILSAIKPIIENEKNLLNQLLNSKEANKDHALKEYCMGKLSGIELMESLYKMESSR